MPEQGVALIARPRFDKATEYGHYYMGLAADYLRTRMRVRDLSAAYATKLNINAALDEEDPLFCYWLGHGNADTYTCQNQEVYMQTCSGDERLIGRNVLLLSCSCGIRLGPDMANKGALAVHCWAVDFTWVAVGDPASDHYARGFFEAVNEIAYAHAEGQLPMVAHNRSMAVWEKWIDYWSASTDEYASMVVQYMVNDRDGMRLFGVGDTPSTPPGGVEGVTELEMPLVVGQALVLLSIVI